VNLIEQTKIETIDHKNWDFYRDNYLAGNYTHDDLIVINDYWFDILREQVFFHPAWAKRLLGFLVDGFEVVELGCYCGELAMLMLNQFPNIYSWKGYDVCSKAIKHSKQHEKYHPIHLSEKFWDTKIETHDVFVSTHTLEHFASHEVFSILDYIEPKTRHAMYLEMPIKEKGKVWRGGGSSHVLRWGRVHFRSFFKKRGWKILFEQEKGMDWAIGVYK